MSRCQPGSRLQVLSLDSGQAAAAAYLLLASPAKDTLNGPKTKRTARLRGLQPADASWPVLSLFSFQEESRTANSRWTKRAGRSSWAWHTTPQQFVREDRFISVKRESETSKIPLNTHRCAKAWKCATKKRLYLEEKKLLLDLRLCSEIYTGKNK